MSSTVANDISDDAELVRRASDENAPAGFASRLGVLLRDVRLERGMRIRHLADEALPARSLRAAEAGELELEPVTVTELAMRYGVELGKVMELRTPIVIESAGSLRVGGDLIAFEPGDGDSLLARFLEAVRSIRSLDEGDMVALRRQDIEALAYHLELPARAVIDRLGVVMGASVEQRRAMVGLYVAKAAVIGCASAN